MSEEAIRDLVEVSRPHLLHAKRWLMDHVGHEYHGSSVDGLLAAYVSDQGLGDLHVEYDLEPDEDQLRRVADSISHRLAFSYGLWELIHAGALIQGHGAVESKEVSVGYKHQHGGASWKFPELRHSLPPAVLPLAGGYGRTPLTDGDLFLDSLGVDDLHPGVTEALREAVRCYRHDLLTATLAMLMAAAEGVWVGLARVLVEALPGHSKVQKLKKLVEGDFVSIARRVNQVAEVLQDKNLAGELLVSAGVRTHAVHDATDWTHRVRDSRNVLHWDYDPEMPNTHEKVSLLMLGTAPALRTLSRIHQAAEKRG